MIREPGNEARARAAIPQDSKHLCMRAEGQLCISFSVQDYDSYPFIFTEHALSIQECYI